MDSKQIELYERIKAFSLDKPDAQLPFSKRLARDNGWKLEYTQRVIEEYKKFAFLAVTAGHPVTPSDQIDQVWHLHLTYTRSYWEEFCPQVLQTQLHHDPTRGGQTENQKFDDWYSKTLESYERFFGEVPPVDIWPTPEVRFGRDLRFVRVNTQMNWVLSKLQIRKGVTASAAIVVALVLSGCYQIISVESSQSAINQLPEVLLTAIFVGAVGFGLIQFIVGVVNTLKNRSAPRVGGRWDSGGCAAAGCGNGWGWGDSSGHHGGGDSSGSGDSGSGDTGGGCGGGGCGGGGCGGGG